MSNSIKNIEYLRKILWADAFLGGFTALVGLTCTQFMTNFLGLSSNFILIVSEVTFIYAIGAFVLAKQKNISVYWLQILVKANWYWTAISGILLNFHWDTTTSWGTTFLILQVIVVGGLAYLEGNEIV
jgi:hypothetical protein